LISFEPEENIIREGKKSLGLYIVASGQIKLYKISPSGREIIINILNPGDSFNEVPVFDNLENPVNVDAVSESNIWLVDAEALQKVIFDYPEAAQKIIVNLSQNLRMLVDKVAELTFYSVTTRLAKLLSQLSPEDLAGTGKERITQDDLASRIGTVREVVARSLKELEQRGAIQIKRGRIKILDRKQLVIDE
jgi:CRP/FNR family transcriptional regulator